MSVVEQDLLTLSEYLNSSLVLVHAALDLMAVVEEELPTSTYFEYHSPSLVLVGFILLCCQKWNRNYLPFLSILTPILVGFILF